MNEEGNIQEKIKKQNHCHKQKLKRACCSMSLTISEDILNTPEQSSLLSLLQCSAFNHLQVHVNFNSASYMLRHNMTLNIPDIAVGIQQPIFLRN